jgi:hypothetical protein
MTVLKQRMLDDLRIRNYAPTTVECYVRSVTGFAKHFNKPPDQLGPEEIRVWQLFLLKERRVKPATYIQAVCGLRFFYRHTLNRKIEIDRIPLPRYERKLPVILRREEVKALLEAPRNLGHRAILATMYGGTTRIGGDQSEGRRPRSRAEGYPRSRGQGAQRSSGSCFPTRFVKYLWRTGDGGDRTSGCFPEGSPAAPSLAKLFSRRAGKQHDERASINGYILIR